MTDKTEFARVVPAMIQEKAADWLLNQIDEQLNGLYQLAAEGSVGEHHLFAELNRAEFHGKIINRAFTAQYTNQASVEGGNTVVVNIATITSRGEKE
ncbi:hypothetical protein HV170_13475 [Citrobacter freundii]|uniref:hypothetical protein n=1 Tax=Citrobacter freundii TaxID=546 RepID=UPI0015F39D36|nr:hypothetical protein [Citrobacter freundii]